MDMYKLKAIMENYDQPESKNNSKKSLGESVVKDLYKPLKENDLTTTKKPVADSKTNAVDSNDEEIITEKELSEGYDFTDHRSGTDDSKLYDIMEEVKELMDQAEQILESNPEYSMTLKRAQSYWLSHIRGALDGNTSMMNMQSAIQEVEEVVNSSMDEDDFHDDTDSLEDHGNELGSYGS